MNFSPLDTTAFIGYFILVGIVAVVVSRREKDSADYFLAGRNLPWWLIGISLIASNISTEQLVGQAGQGAGHHGRTPGTLDPPGEQLQGLAAEQRGIQRAGHDQEHQPGDSTDAEQVARLFEDRAKAALFATDPPYLIGYRGGVGTSPGGRKDWSALTPDPDALDPKKVAVGKSHRSRRSWLCPYRNWCGHGQGGQGLLPWSPLAGGWLAGKYRSVVATDDGHEVMALCRQFLACRWHGEGIHQVQVTALDPRPAA